MKTILPCILILTIAFSFHSCKKTELEGENLLYEGGWVNTKGDKHLSIWNDGSAAYAEYTNEGVSINAKEIPNGRLVIKDDKLKVAGTIKSKKFKINVPPFKKYDEDNVEFYVMTLDNEKFYSYKY
jgi:hypothetical protein